MAKQAQPRPPMNRPASQPHQLRRTKHHPPRTNRHKPARRPSSRMVPFWASHQALRHSKKRTYTKSPVICIPSRRMPKFVLVDQKRIWTSPFHTSHSDIKWWVIFAGATAALIAADQHIERAAPSNSTLVHLGNDTSYLGCGLYAHSHRGHVLSHRQRRWQRAVSRNRPVVV